MGPPKGPPPSTRNNSPPPRGPNSTTKRVTLKLGGMKKGGPPSGSPPKGGSPSASPPKKGGSPASPTKVRPKKTLPPNPNPVNSNKNNNNNNNNKELASHLLYWLDNKYGSSKWIKIFCQLDEATLFLGDEEIDVSESTIYNCSLEEEQTIGRSNILKIETSRPTQTHILACESAEELAVWMSGLSEFSYATHGHNNSHTSNPSITGNSSNPTATNTSQQNLIPFGFQPDIVIEPLSVADDELNDRYQKFMLREEESLEQSVQNGLSLATYIGTFLSNAKHIAQTIVYEYALPTNLQTIKKLSLFDDDGRDSSEEIYLHHGIILRMSQQPCTDEDINPSAERRRNVAVGDTISHKCAGHELRCIHWASQCATAVNRSNDDDQADNDSAPPLVTPLACICDVQGFRFFVMCIPPVDDTNTLVYGNDKGNFLMEDDAISEKIKLMCRYMHLKNHDIDCGGSMGVNNVSAGSEFQGHLCEDGRVYLMNLSRAAPSDLPSPGTNEIITHCLRPEFVQSYKIPLTGDSYRPEMEEMEDFKANAEEACEASLDLHNLTIPALTNSLDNLTEVALDSSSLTRLLHANGINVRYLGKVHNLAKYPHVKSLALVEICSRAAKHILNQTFRQISRKGRAEMLSAEARGRSRDEDFLEHNAKLRREMNDYVLDFLNLVLGMSEESDRFWEKSMLPLMKNKFNLSIQLPKKRYVVFKMASFLIALQHHCSLKLQDHDKYDFTTGCPIKSEDLVSAFDDSKVKWRTNDTVESFALAARGEEFMKKKDWGKALQALNLSLSLHKATFSFSSYNGQMEQAAILNNIADTFFNICEFQEAIDVAKKALSLTPKFSIENSRTYLIMMKAYFKLKDHTESGKCFTKAKKCREWIWGKNHPCVIELTVNLADLFYEDEDLESAAMYVNSALLKSEINLGLKHNLCSELSFKYGILLACRGSTKDSMRLLKRAVLHYSKEEFEGDNVSGVMLGKGEFSLCEVYAQTGDLENAMLSANTALERRMNLKSNGGGGVTVEGKNAMVIESYQQVARIYELKGDLEQAIEFFEKSLSFIKMNNEGGMSKEKVGVVYGLSKKILSLQVVSQPLPMRTMLKQAAENHPSLKVGTKAHEDTIDYVTIVLYNTSPSSYLGILLEHIADADGCEDNLPQLPSDVSFSGMTPSPAAQLAALSKIAEESVKNEKE